MTFHKSTAEIAVFSPVTPEDALRSSTDLCIAAHQDDIEIMAYGAIAACYDDPKRAFCGAVVSNGEGSPRSGIYSDYSDTDMTQLRIEEQKNAARIGNYCAQVFLGFKSSEIKDTNNYDIIDDIHQLLLSCHADTVYTHNLADKHDTHVAVALRTIEALRLLPEELRPKKVYSMEVWRGLDWLCDNDKSVFDTSGHPNIASAILGVFDSQIAGGKRYDAAAIGRRLANATFFKSNSVDTSDSLSFGLDITQLVYDKTLSPADFIRTYISNFENDVISRISKLSKEE